jgi:hypothetical protein
MTKWNHHFKPTTIPGIKSPGETYVSSVSWGTNNYTTYTNSTYINHSSPSYSPSSSYSSSYPSSGLKMMGLHKK